jgi:hypothetical protein
MSDAERNVAASIPADNRVADAKWHKTYLVVVIYTALLIFALYLFTLAFTR